MKIDPTSDLDSKKCFLSTTGITAEGPFSLGELKAANSSGTVSNGALCSVLSGHSTYESWSPIAYYTHKRASLGSSSKSTPRIKDILDLYVGWFIALNITDPKGLDIASLIHAGEDHFSVVPRGSENTLHYPYSQILSLSEASTMIACKIIKPIDRTIKQGVLSKLLVGDASKAQPEWADVRIEVPLLIEVKQLIVYKGATSVGISIPVGQ